MQYKSNKDNIKFNYLTFILYDSCKQIFLKKGMKNLTQMKETNRVRYRIHLFVVVS